MEFSLDLTLQCFFLYFGNGADAGQIGKKSSGLTQIGNFILNTKFLLGISFIQGDMEISHNVHFKTMYY
jgi:hypothetical protein